MATIIQSEKAFKAAAVTYARTHCGVPRVRGVTVAVARKCGWVGHEGGTFEVVRRRSDGSAEYGPYIHVDRDGTCSITVWPPTSSG